ncbi:hypothetical protein J7M28_12030 [bacterium]|nr:hypothetical protein [bacterium]
MIYGAIDIGTGSVLCLAAERSDDEAWHELISESVITSLGAGTEMNSSVALESQGRTIAAVVDYVQRLKALGAGHISLVGTSALRRAENREEFIERVRCETGLSVEVISGEEEGRLTFWGATQGLLTRARPVVVMDVGGGSSELVFGRAASGRAPASPNIGVSIPIGALALTDRFISAYPISTGESYQLKKEIDEALCTEEVRTLVESANRASERPLLVGVGGSATTLVAMRDELDPYVPSRVHLSSVTRSVLHKHIERLGAMSLDRRHRVVGLPKGRAPVIDAGLSILHAIMNLFGADSMTVSDRGLRHGIIIRDASRL